MKYFLYIILWVWQFPQHLLGLFFWIIYRKDIIKKYLIDSSFSKIYIIKDRKFLRKDWIEGISLGFYIFLDSGNDSPEILSHEAGHTIQSKWLGPLYLFIVGIISFIRASLKMSKKKYYDGWPEKQATNLGKNLIILEIKN